MLLGGKFARPIASKGFIHIEQLSNRLKSPLTLIQAPEGCLLTESLAAILEEEGQQIVWLRFGWEDFDPAICLLSLIEAFQKVNKNIGTATLENMRRLPGLLQGWPDLYAQLGYEIRECLDESIILVLEKLHYLNQLPQTLTLLGKYFLSALSEQTSVILISKQNLPPYSLPKQPELIHAQDLRLSTTAIDGLFRYKELNPDKACLQQAVHLLSGNPVELTGICKAAQLMGEAYLQDLLRRQTNQKGLCDQIARDWLKILDEREIQSVGILFSLSYNHPFINQSQTGSAELNPSPWAQSLSQDWVRPHSLWLTGIETALRANFSFRRESIHAAAEYLCRNGFLISGINLFFASGAITLAAEYLAQNADEMLSMGQWDLLKAFLERLPAPILTRQPRLLHAAGEIKSAEGDQAGAAFFFQRARDQYIQHNDQAGYITSLLAISTLSARKGEAGEAWSSAYSALQLAQTANLPRQKSIAKLQISLLALQSGDIQGAISHLELAAESACSAGDTALVERINELHKLALQQERFQQQQQQKHQLYLSAQQAEQANLRYLQQAIQKPLDKNGPGWSSQGWLLAPLSLKLGLDIATNGQALNSKKNLVGKISNWLRLGLAKGDHPKMDHHQTEESGYLDDGLIEGVYPAIAEEAALQEPVEDNIPQRSDHEIAPVAAKVDLIYPVNEQPEAEAAKESSEIPSAPILSAYMLGEFLLVVDGAPLDQPLSGLSGGLLKYLIHNHKRKIPRDELMENFWPEVEPESARNRLNVTLSKIRSTLRRASNLEIIIFDADKYYLNPELQIWIDAEQLENNLAEARQLQDNNQANQAVRLLETAASLYQGDFLAEDKYEEWTVLIREHLRLAYLDALHQLSRYYFESQQYTACTAICQSILARDNCREDVHCLLMRCYAYQGQIPLALRQYQTCAQALHQELDVAPAASTLALYEQLRRREIIEPYPAT